MEAKELADNYRFSYMECSAKSGESVEEVFTQLGRMMKERIIDVATKATNESGIFLQPSTGKFHEKCCSN